MAFYYISLILMIVTSNADSVIHLIDSMHQTDGVANNQDKKFVQNEQTIQKTMKRSVSEDEHEEYFTNSDNVSQAQEYHVDTTKEYSCEMNSTEHIEPLCTNSSVTSMSHAYTCEFRCNDTEMIPGFMRGPYCSCHPLCLISHDCCLDFQQFCPELYELGERKRETLASIPNSLHAVDCMNIFGMKLDIPYWMIGHCPVANVNETMRMKCEGQVTEFIQILPVVSQTTDVIYKNLFCAQCNNVFNIIPWGLNVTCEEVWEGSLDSPQKLLELVYGGMCDLMYEPLLEHKCLSKYFSQPMCSDQSSACIQKYKDMCEYGFQMPVSIPYAVTSFKNIYCFMCDMLERGYQKNDLTCDLLGDTPGVVEPDSGGYAKFSFGILVDYNPTAGNKVGFIFKEETKLFGCDAANSENLDCVSYCADGFEYKGGECVFKYRTFDLNVWGMWYAPDFFWLAREPYIWLPLKKKLTELFIDILQSSIIETITLEQDSYVQNQLNFDITCKYKLHVGNSIPLEEIHSTLFKNIVTETIFAYPNVTHEILNLNVACMTLFDRRSCWDHGRITHSGKSLTASNITNGQNKTDQLTNGTSDSLIAEIYKTTDCPRKSISANSIEILSNGSVLFIDSGELLSEDEFILVRNTVYICVNDSGMSDSTSEVWKYDETMGLLTIICTSLSLICMFIRLILQPFVPLFQNFPGKLQFSFILSLFLASLFFLIGPNCISLHELCVTLGVLIHWSYLSVFAWTVIIARDMYYIFSPSSFAKSSDTNISVLKLYILLAWGIPAVIVAISLGLDFSNIDPVFKPMYGRGICWISQRYALLIFFTSPIAVTILVNLGFFIPTAISLWKSMKKRIQSSKKSAEYPFGIYSKLFCLMGFTWIFAFIAPYNIALWYIFIVLNASQGVYIFLAFVLRKQVWESLSHSVSKMSSVKTSSSHLSSKSTGQIQSSDKAEELCPTASVNVNECATNEIETKVDAVNLAFTGDKIDAIEMEDRLEMKGDEDIKDDTDLKLDMKG